MLDPKEIDIEIARLEYGESSYPAYQKLANLYTIRNQMMKKAEQREEPIQAYSLAAAPELSYTGRYGDSDFLREIEGKDLASAWAVMDDLMDTLHTVNPRVYDGVMRKIRSI